MTQVEERLEAVEERTDRLETLFGQFMAQTGIALRRIDRSIERIDRSIERMEETVAEMKAEGARDREKAARSRREMNKRWGDLANKMGTLVEDIIAPSLRRMAGDQFNCDAERFFADRLSRTRSDDPGRRREFDALYVGSEAVLPNETKSTPRSEDVRTFVDFLDSGEFNLYFPEYQNLPLVPVFSSLSIPEDLVTSLTRNGIYAVAMGEETMQVLNLTQVQQQDE